jgi:acetyl esterase/lipase
VGGSKDEIRNYLQVIAGHGYVVASPSYSLAPENRYPTPLIQVMAALGHLASNADRHGADASRIILAGDSAGAHVAAQVAALLTTPGYDNAVGVRPTIGPEALRGLVLACGPYSVELAREASSPAGRLFIKTVMWAYSGKRRFLDDPTFRRASVVDHVGAAFPPTLVTVGNADPLRQHSELLVDRLRSVGSKVETMFWPAAHEPPLGHEYQFDLDTDAGQTFMARLVDFLGRRTGSAVTS